MRQCTRKALTTQAVQEAMVRHDGLVHAFIRRQGGGDIPYEEALQAGRIGLWHAIQGYDPMRGTTFSTYAWVAICRQIHRRAKELSRESAVELLEMPAVWGLPDLAEELERKQTQAVLYDLVDQLPPPHSWRLRQVLDKNTAADYRRALAQNAALRRSRRPKR